MNINIRLFQLIKPLSCRNSYKTPNIARLSNIGGCREFLTIQRGVTTKPNLVRGKSIRLKPRVVDEIGPSGYFLLIIPISTLALGVWQIWRWKWKLGLIEDLQTRTNSEPVELPEDLSNLESMEYRPVKVRGRFIHEREIVAGPRSLIINGAGVSEGAGGVLTPGKSNTGFCLITPFKLEDRDLTILVNRGWVPRTYKADHAEAKNNTDDVVELTGVVRLNEHRPQFIPKNAPSSGNWFYRDLKAMGNFANTAPVYIELLASETIRGGPIAGQTRVALRNEHFSYIVTWFALSGFTGWMWCKKFILKSRVY